jgi:hypothetical protein
MTTIKLNNKEIDIEAIKAILTEEQIQELTSEEENNYVVPVGVDFYVIQNGVIFNYKKTHEQDLDNIIKNNIIYYTDYEALEAQKRNQARIRVIRKIAELNASVGWKVDWNDRQQYKCFLYFNGTAEEVRGESVVRDQELEDYFYFSSEVMALAIEACAEDYKIMLGIK